MGYYYSKNENQFGPLPIELLLKVINKDTLVWNEDGSMENWQKAIEVAELSTAMNLTKPIEVKSSEPQNTAITVQAKESKPVDKKQILEDYISNKLLNGFTVIKKDETDFLVELEKKNGIAFKNSFPHKKYFYKLLLIDIIGIILWSIYYNYIWYEMDASSESKLKWYIDGHLTWIFTIAIPSVIYITMWRKAYKKQSIIPPTYSDLQIRCVVNDTGKAIEQAINKI